MTAIRGYCIGKTVGIRKELERELLETENRLHELETLLDGMPETMNRLQETKKKYSQVLERVRCHDYKKYIAKAHDTEGKVGRILANHGVHRLRSYRPRMERLCFPKKR